MDYHKHYSNLIESRRLLIRNKKDGIYEQHHIIPKCFGGSNKSYNLILLTPREHYIAHLLLTQMYTGKNKAKMCYALLKMCSNNPLQHRIISSKQYEFARKLVTETCNGENAPFFGKKLPKDVRRQISDRMKGDNNPSRKYGVWNKGLKMKPQSEETKLKRSNSLRGQKRTEKAKLNMSIASKGKPKSIAHKKRLSEVNKGKKLSSETKLKMSLARKGVKQKTIKCIHCGKEGSITGIKRWHLDNCKFK